MKKIILWLSAITFTMTLVSFTLIPLTPDGDHPNAKEQREATSNVMSDNDETTESSASPCACSKFACSNGHRLKFSFKAWKKYSGRKCSVCDGTGYLSNGRECTYCEGGGWEFDWQSGCICERCGEVYLQPDDC